MDKISEEQLKQIVDILNKRGLKDDEIMNFWRDFELKSKTVIELITVEVVHGLIAEILTDRDDYIKVINDSVINDYKKRFDKVNGFVIKMMAKDWTNQQEEEFNRLSIDKQSELIDNYIDGCLKVFGNKKDIHV